MTLNEASYFIAGRLGQAENEVFLNEVKFAIGYWRAFLIRQDVEKNGASPLYQQRITKAVALVDKADTCALQLGCKVVRTNVRVPTPIALKIGAPFMSVMTANLNQAIGYVPYSDLPYAFTGKYSKDKLVYTWMNDHVYVYGNNKLDFVTIVHPFVNPYQVIDDCSVEEACLNHDSEYPCPENMFQTIVQGLLNGELSIRPNYNPEVNVESNIVHQQQATA